MPQNEHASLKTKTTFSMSQLVYKKGSACYHISKYFQVFLHFFLKLLLPLALLLASKEIARALSFDNRLLC